MTNLLIVDDQVHVRTSLRILLKAEGYRVFECADGEKAVEALRERAFDLILCDQKMPGLSGMDVLRFKRSESIGGEFILMTAFGSIDSAVEAMRLGAADYIQKPFQNDELELRIDRALEHRRVRAELALMIEEFREKYGVENLVGSSEAMKRLLVTVTQMGGSVAPVLIRGASGTGKDLVARALHVNSARAENPFVTVDCAAFNETLLESELFGHVRGAFTGAVADRRGLFAQASGGTLFLDRIGETSPAVQAKLLRVLQSGEVRALGASETETFDLRILSSTSRDLPQDIADGRFREDLYYRLNVLSVQVPSLEERRSDVPLLVEHFLKEHRGEQDASIQFSADALSYLRAREYPGNVRELQSLVARAVSMSPGPIITEDFLREGDRMLGAESQGNSIRLDDVVRRAEGEAIREALSGAAANRERAASQLGISVTTLWRKMKSLGID